MPLLQYYTPLLLLEDNQPLFSIDLDGTVFNITGLSQLTDKSKK